MAGKLINRSKMTGGRESRVQLRPLLFAQDVKYFPCFSEHVKNIEKPVLSALSYDPPPDYMSW